MNTEKAFHIIEQEMKVYHKSQQDSVNSILRLTSEITKKETQKLNDFLNNECCLYLKEKKRIYKENDIDGSIKFNFFESISDLYYRENFHSDILEVILNPNTTEIGRKYFMQEFVNLLGLTQEQFDFNSDFEVIREKEKRIDLFVKNEKKKQAIIIENKINYAPDMDNQLVRYMKHVHKDLGIDNYTVVYLTLIDDKNKKPPLDSYDKKYEDYTNKLKNDDILKEVYAVDPNKSLAKTFIPNCQKLLLNEINKNPKDKLDSACNTAYVYLEQYKILLNHLGGEAYMSQTDKDTIRDIFSSKEKLETAMDFMDIWGNSDLENCRNSDREFIKTIKDDNKKEQAATAFEDLWERREILLYNTLYDSIKEQINNSEFHSYTDTEDDIVGIRKEFKDLYICFYIQYRQNKCIDWGFGFNKKKNLTVKQFDLKKKELKEILTKVNNIEGFKQEIYHDSYWICKQLDFAEIERNKVILPYLVKEIVEALRILDEEYSEFVDK